MKQLLIRYPTVGMLMAFFVTSFLFAYLSGVVKAVAFAVSVFIWILLFLKPFLRLIGWEVEEKRETRKLILLYATAVAVSALVSFIAFNVVLPQTEKAVGKTETARIRITECVSENYGLVRLKAKIVSSDSLPSGVGILVSYPHGKVDDGTVLDCELTYYSLNSRDSGSFDGRRYYLSEHVFLLAEAEEMDYVEMDERITVDRLFRVARDYLSAKFGAFCTKDCASLACAVLLGDRTNLSASVKRDFRRTGISHLLAISGTHFSAVITLLEYAMRRLRFRPKLRAGINFIFILFFMGLTGFTPSVVRAGIMHGLAQLSVLVVRKPNMVNSYALSGALIVLINPYAILDIGLQLSYVATFACLVYLLAQKQASHYFRSHFASCRHPKWTRILRKLCGTALLTLVVTMFTLPLTWLYFGEISLVAIPVTLIMMPLITVFLYGTVFYLILYPITPLVPWLGGLLGVIADGIVKLIRFIASFRFVTLPVNYDFALFFLLPLAALLLMIPFVKRKNYAFLSACGVFITFLAVILCVRASDRTGTSVMYIPSGINDGLLVQSEGKTALCDMSVASIRYTYTLTDALAQYHATEIEAVVYTHYHARQSGVFGALCEREIVRNLVLPKPQNEKEAGVCRQLTEIAEENGVNVISLPPGCEYRLGKAAISIAERTYLKRSTHPITAVEVNVGNEQFLLLSSSWNESSLAEEVGDATVLIFGEHSPVYKKAFTLDAPLAKQIICGNEAAAFFENYEEYAEKIVPRQDCNTIYDSKKP